MGNPTLCCLLNNNIDLSYSYCHVSTSPFHLKLTLKIRTALFAEIMEYLKYKK
jgi:hypothetical protein